MTTIDVRSRRTRRAFAVIPTIVLLLAAAYTLFPLLWVVMASTKSSGELFSTFSLAPGTGFFDNIAALSSFEGGKFWMWSLNSLIYAGGGALLSTLVSALAGYALARFEFRGRAVLFTVLFAGVLLPGITLAIPQYFLVASAGISKHLLGGAAAVDHQPVRHLSGDHLCAGSGADRDAGGRAHRRRG